MDVAVARGPPTLAKAGKRHHGKPTRALTPAEGAFEPNTKGRTFI